MSDAGLDENARVPDSSLRLVIDACDGAIGELANGGATRIPEMIDGLALIRDRVAQGRWQDDDWDKIEAAARAVIDFWKYDVPGGREEMDRRIASLEVALDG